MYVDDGLREVLFLSALYLKFNFDQIDYGTYITTVAI